MSRDAINARSEIELLEEMVKKAERDGSVSSFKSLYVYAQRDLSGRLHAVFTIDRQITNAGAALEYLKRESETRRG